MLELEQILRTLVATHSVTGNEAGIARYLGNYCVQLGFRAFDVNGNVAVCIPGRSRRRALLFNGHMDTVVGEWHGTNALWKTADGRLVGLGTSDMKGGLAVMLGLAQQYSLTPPPCDIWLLFSRDEEETGAGSDELARWLRINHGHRYSHAEVIVLEPTGNAYLGIGHRGGGIYTVEAYGMAHHGAKRGAKGVAAIKQVMRFLDVLEKLEPAWQAKYSDKLFGVPTLNVTEFHAGTGSANMVPDVARAKIDIRTTWALGQVLPGIMQQLASDLNLRLIPPDHEPLAVLCPPRAAIVPAFGMALPSLPTGAFPAATDVNAFLGAGFPAVIFGPGDPDTMHEQDESIPDGAMEACQSMLLEVAKAFEALN